MQSSLLQKLLLLVVLVVAGASATAASPTQRRLLNTTDMSNGAKLSVHLDIDDPSLSGGLPLTQGLPIGIQGNASIGLGEPDVAYIYIMDESGSTSAQDYPCPTVLDCVQEFFLELHDAVVQDGSAELAAVITFDSQAYVQSGWFDPRDPSEANTVFWSLGFAYPDGGTNCEAALYAAAGLVAHPNNTAGTTIVVFAGDGECDAGGQGVPQAADVLANTGAIVYTVAVGDSVDCSNSQGTHNELSDIPRNGGTCISVPDPHTLPQFVDDIIGTELVSLEYNIDGGNYTDITGLSLENGAPAMLPLGGATLVNFDTVIAPGLSAGVHRICARATGQDALNGTAQIEECREVTVSETPSAAPSIAPSMAPTGAPTMTPTMAPTPKTFEGWEVFLISASVFVLGALFSVAARALYFRNQKDADPKDLKLEASTEEGKNSGEAEGEPKPVV